jgi:hypothetical protein
MTYTDAHIATLSPDNLKSAIATGRRYGDDTTRLQAAYDAHTAAAKSDLVTYYKDSPAEALIEANRAGNVVTIFVD